MGRMYKETCHEFTEGVVQALASELIYKGQYALETVNEGVFAGEVWIQYDLDGVSTFEILNAPECTYTGLENLMGVTVDDAVEASWLVALTLIAAWAVLVIKRTF